MKMLTGTLQRLVSDDKNQYFEFRGARIGFGQGHVPKGNFKSEMSTYKTDDGKWVLALDVNSGATGRRLRMAHGFGTVEDLLAKVDFYHRSIRDGAGLAVKGASNRCIAASSAASEEFEAVASRHVTQPPPAATPRLTLDRLR